MEKEKSKKKSPGQPARMTIGDKALATKDLREAQAKVKASGQLVVPAEALAGQLVVPAEALESLEADWAKAGQDRTAVTVFNRGADIVLHQQTPDEYIAAEYPWLEKSQDVPRLLKALLREVVTGRMHG